MPTMTEVDAAALAAKLDLLAADWNAGQRETRDILLDQARRLEALEERQQSDVEALTARIAKVEGLTTEQIQRAVMEGIGRMFSPPRVAAAVILLAGALDAGQRIIAVVLR